MSCKKAQKYFEENDVELKSKSDARKEKIDAQKAWELISAYKKVHIGKGKKVLSLEPSRENKEDILKSAMGRSGNLRAPALTTKDTVFIGFNEEIYSNL